MQLDFVETLKQNGDMRSRVRALMALLSYPWRILELLCCIICSMGKLSVRHEEFTTRIWKKKGIDKVIAQPDGFLIVRFPFVSEHGETLK